MKMLTPIEAADICTLLDALLHEYVRADLVPVMRRLETFIEGQTDESADGRGQASGASGDGDSDHVDIGRGADVA